MTSPRNYGLADITDYTDGPPTWEKMPGGIKCPNCGCESLCLVQVMIKEAPLLRMTLRSSRGVGTYAGCPACPWASPMMIVGVADDGPA